MPRNPENSNEFIAGQLPIVTFKRKKYYVDGRMKELRNVKDFMDRFECRDISDESVLARNMSLSDLAILNYEFFGIK